MKPLSFFQAVVHLYSVIKWRFKKKEYIGRRVYIAGKVRPVIAENYDSIFVKGLSHAISKDNRYLRV